MSVDFIFAGAGPAGLTGAICAARKGRKCLVIEKKPSLDLNPRGETLRYRPILDEILGDGVMASLAVVKTPHLEYFAPEPEMVDCISLKMHADNITFDWSEFMQAFQRQISALDIDLQLSAEVIDIKEDSGIVSGVVYKDAEGKKVGVDGGVIFAGDGHNSIIGRKAGVDYRSMNHPIVKGLYKNASFDNPALKFFFIPGGSMKFAPDFPPAIAFLFPRDGKNCEAAVLVMAESAKKLGYEIPTPDELIRVWQLMADQYPMLSDMLRDASPEILEATELPMTGPLENLIPKKGVVLLGDAAGFIEVSGGSGIVSSMESARFWVNAFIREQNKTADRALIWKEETMRRLNEAFTVSPLFRHIKANAERNTAAYDLMFVGMRTSQEIIKNWETVRDALDIY